MYYETQEKEAYRNLLPELFGMPNRLLVYTFICDFYKMKGQTQPYKEASIFILGTYKGEEIWHCIYMPVTSEESMRAGINRLGLPKSIGDIEFSRAETSFSATVIDENKNIMSLEIDTSQYTFSNAEETEIKALSIIPKVNIRKGKVIKMGKKSNEKGERSKSSIIDIAKAVPNRISLKEGLGQLSFNFLYTKDNSNTKSPLALKPSKIIGAYYLKNTIPFSLTGNSF